MCAAGVIYSLLPGPKPDRTALQGYLLLGSKVARSGRRAFKAFNILLQGRVKVKGTGSLFLSLEVWAFEDF